MGSAEELVAEIKSARPHEIVLFGSQRRRIRAFMERLNQENPDDQIDPGSEDDVALTVTGLIDTALRTVEDEAGLVSDTLGNLRSLR